MDTTIQKQQTSFRLNTKLLEQLKAEAKKENRSLNNYVECILMDVLANRPNKETMEAIQEVRSGKYLRNKPVDLTDTESMMKSILE